MTEANVPEAGKLALPFEGVPSPVLPPVGGAPRHGYSREMPPGMVHPQIRGNLTTALPWPLVERGCELLRIEAAGGDPYVLYDAWGHILAQWEREPSLGELLGFC